NFSEQESSLPEKIHRCSWYVLDGCACGCYNQGTLAFPARPSGRDMRRDKSNFLVGLSLWSSELKPASRGLFRCCLFRHCEAGGRSNPESRDRFSIASSAL